MNKYWGGVTPRSVHLRICSSLDASDGIYVIIYAINYYAVILQGSRHYWGKLSKFTYFCEFVTLCQLGYISWFSVQSKACFRFKFSLKCLIKLEFQVSDLKLNDLLFLNGDQSLFMLLVLVTSCYTLPTVFCLEIFHPFW